MKKSDIIQLSNSLESKRLVKYLYTKVDITTNEYLEWEEKFRFLHGEFDKQKKVSFESLSTRYVLDIKSQDDLFKLLFSLESLYVGLLKCFVFHRLNLNDNNVFHKDWFKIDELKSFQIASYYSHLINVDIKANKLLFDIYKKMISKMDLDANFDFVRELYEDLFDKRIRHSVGEYFTPDWLAQLIIKKVVQNDNIENKKFLDPTCGSGTFIRSVINLYKDKTKGKVFNNVYGIDINPVSVLAAKTNYFILYFNYFDKAPNVLPIFEADIIKEIDYSNDLFNNEKQLKFIDIGFVDYVIGNPPWVNWEYLPKKYKLETAEAWKYFNLYNGKGLESQFLKEDISVLITYVVLHKYLKDDGRLAFLLKESLIKSVKQAKTFRRFNIKPTNTPLKVNFILDLTNISPFEGINPRTIGLFLTKNQKTEYPFLYQLLKTKSGKKRFGEDIVLNEVEKDFKYEDLLASPSDLDDNTSALKTVDKELFELSEKIHGISFYKARTGTFTGGSNAIFWMNILNANDSICEVENITERAKNKVEKIRAKIESDYLYPFITGADIGFWNFNYDKYILFPHTLQTKMSPISYEDLSKVPLTKKYFEYFKDNLEKRKGFTGLDKHIHKEYYYTLQRIGEYTFAPYKVAWKYISKEFVPVVIKDVNDSFLGNKTLIPNEKIIYIGLENKDEAYYVCGILSSTIYRKTIESFMLGTQITPSIISKLALPKFDNSNEIHIEISKLCEQGHNPKEDKHKLIKEIDDYMNAFIG